MSDQTPDKPGSPGSPDSTDKMPENVPAPARPASSTPSATS